MDIISVLKDFTLRDAKWIEENLDEQFKALKFLFKNIKDKALFVKLVVLNSIVSYQLNCRGEEYWWEFSKYFSKNISNDIILGFKEFLRKSRCNRRILNTKLKRIDKITPFIERLNEKMILDYSKDLLKFLNDISKVMNQKPTDKTMVFSVKMFGYSVRIAYKIDVTYPFEIDIPMDIRIRKISNDINFWRKLSKETNIPPLHLDSIIWVIMGIKTFNSIPFEIRGKILKLKSYLSKDEVD